MLDLLRKRTHPFELAIGRNKTILVLRHSIRCRNKFLFRERDGTIQNLRNCPMFLQRLRKRLPHRLPAEDTYYKN